MKSGLIDIVMFIIGIGVTAAVYFLTSYQEKIARKRLEASFSGSGSSSINNDTVIKSNRNYFSWFDGIYG